MAENTNDTFRRNHCKTPEWLADLEMPCFDLEIQEFLEDSTNGEPAEMTEISPTSETFQRNGNNSHDSEIECEINNDSQELEDFISAQRSSNTVKKTKSDMRALQRFCASINETREPEKKISSELDKLYCQNSLRKLKKKTAKSTSQVRSPLSNEASNAILQRKSYLSTYLKMKSFPVAVRSLLLNERALSTAVLVTSQTHTETDRRRAK